MFRIRAISALILGLSFAASAEAKSFSVPSDRPMATLDVADDWHINDSDKDGIVAKSADDAVTIAAGTASAKDEEKVLGELIATLAENGFKPDESSKKGGNTEADLDGNHAKITLLSYAGKDNDGPANITITTYEFDKRADQIFVLALLIGSKVTKDDGKATGSIMDSIHFTP